jgi:Phage tail baseplate hub (GPD)
MAEHIKLTRTAAKAGVTMALLALLAGVAGNAMGEGTSARPAAQVLKGGSALKLNVNGLSPELRHDLANIETDFNFVSRLMEEEGIFYYFKHGGAGHRLLTIGDANATFLKSSAANAKFLAISDANATFLRISDANAKFLPISDANAKFLQGVSGAATLSGSAQQELLSIPGFEVDVSTNGDGLPSVTINNGTGIALPAVQDQGGTDGTITLQPGKNSLTLTLQNGVDQLHLQTFPAGGFNRVLTLTISINFNAAQASSSFASQLINGGS